MRMCTDNPLVSIIIPTYNSESTLPLCLKSIKNQTYKNLEVIIVDSYSNDKTIDIAKEFDAKVIRTSGRLLWARYIGHLYAKGEIELLLDSDQVLDPTAIERGVKLIMKGYDMIILEEKSYKPRTITQWLFYIDRKYVHKINDLNPVHGVLLARMYKYELLNKVFKDIRQRLPLEVMFKLVAHDHAIIYYEAWKYTSRITILRDAVYHIEPANFSNLIRKFYRYGKTEFDLSRYYPELVRGKKCPRKPSLDLNFSVSILLWMLKAIPYCIGKLSNR